MEKVGILLIVSASLGVICAADVPSGISNHSLRVNTRRIDDATVYSWRNSPTFGDIIIRYKVTLRNHTATSPPAEIHTYLSRKISRHTRRHVTSTLPRTAPPTAASTTISTPSTISTPTTITIPTTQLSTTEIATQREKTTTITAGNPIHGVGFANFSAIERSGVVAANLQHAGCQPYEQIVAIPNDKAHIVMYPSCVKVKQCGGCCSHPSLTCKPTSTNSKNVQVMKYVYDGSAAHPSEMVEVVSIDEHLACECSCKMTADQCHPNLHAFDDWDCQCKCKKPRTACAEGKIWDDGICDCRCKSVLNCGVGYKFNIFTCSCDEDSERGGANSGVNGNPAVKEQQPHDRVTAVIETDPCPHLRCPRRYKAVISKGGRCMCKYTRTRG